MFGRMKAFAGQVGRKLVEPEAVLFGLVVTWVLVAFVMNGCGGGGGGPQPQPTTQQPQPSERQTAHSVASAVAKAQDLLREFGVSAGRLRLVRSRQSACPTITSNWDGTGPLPNPYVETYDYGDGCKNKEGKFLKGKVTFTINDPEIDEEGNLMFTGFSISFTNFGDKEETFNGTLSLSETPYKPMVYRVSYDLRYSNIKGCSERVTFNGTIETDDFIDVGEPTQVLWNGTGTYSGPSGNFQYEMTDLLGRLYTPCEYPEGGIMKLTADGVTMTIIFSDVCGQATVAIPVKLPPLDEDDPYDPCD